MGINLRATFAVNASQALRTSPSANCAPGGTLMWVAELHAVGNQDESSEFITMKIGGSSCVRTDCP